MLLNHTWIPACAGMTTIIESFTAFCFLLSTVCFSVVTEPCPLNPAVPPCFPLSPPLLVPQRFNRVELRRAGGGEEAEEDSCKGAGYERRDYR